MPLETKPLNTLVYTTAFGDDHFFRLAETMLRSLRRRGYAGDAAVIADRPHVFAADLDARVIVLPDVSGSPLVKARLHELADISGYDRILFVDSDVVFLGDPAPVFALSGERMMLSRDHCPLARNGFNLTFFAPEERRDPALARTRSINTGIVAFPGARYAEYAETWLRGWRDPVVQKRIAALPRGLGELRDQPVLQRLVHRGELDAGFLPDPLFLMPLFFTEEQPLHPDAVFVHLNGTSRSGERKEFLRGVMEEFNTAGDHATHRAICDRLQAGRRRRASFAPLP